MIALIMCVSVCVCLSVLRQCAYVCVCVQEVVERFITQGDSQKHLQELKEENERILLQLKKDRDELQKHFQDTKYSGEAKLSRSELRRLKKFCVSSIFFFPSVQTEFSFTFTEPNLLPFKTSPRASSMFSPSVGQSS